MSVPNALPSSLPAGRYHCEIVSDPVQKASTFPGKEGTFYFSINMRVRADSGQWYDYPFGTTLKSPAYHAILRACGGRVLENGMTEGPDTLVGKKFIAKIGERLSQDKKRTINELLDVWPCPEEGPVETSKIVNDEGEEAPF